MEIILPAANAAIFFSIAALHLYWIIGGSEGMDATIPTDSNGRRKFRPGRGITFVVVLGLLLFGLWNLSFAGWLQIQLSPLLTRYGILFIGLIFLMRAIGDFRYIGFTKRQRQTRFARLDTSYYTPLCLMLAVSHFLLFLI